MAQTQQGAAHSRGAVPHCRSAAASDHTAFPPPRSLKPADTPTTARCPSASRRSVPPPNDSPTSRAQPRRPGLERKRETRGRPRGNPASGAGRVVLYPRHRTGRQDLQTTRYRKTPFTRGFSQFDEAQTSTSVSTIGPCHCHALLEIEMSAQMCGKVPRRTLEPQAHSQPRLWHLRDFCRFRDAASWEHP